MAKRSRVLASWTCICCAKEISMQGIDPVTEGVGILEKIGWKDTGGGFLCPPCQSKTTEELMMTKIERRLLEVERRLGIGAELQDLEDNPETHLLHAVVSGKRNR